MLSTWQKKHKMCGKLVSLARIVGSAPQSTARRRSTATLRPRHVPSKTVLRLPQPISRPSVSSSNGTLLSTAAAASAKYSWMLMRSAWLGIRTLDGSTALVMGLVSCVASHSSSAERSNEWPSTVLTGSTMMSCVMGQMKDMGARSMALALAIVAEWEMGEMEVRLDGCGPSGEQKSERQTL